ncbi:MAG: hypothetical protein ACFB6S_19650 [Geminicoccaceae bacterium]
MNGWQVRQLTFGGDRQVFHAHSYYDIPVFDRRGEKILVHRLRFAERHPSPEDAIDVGIVHADAPGEWTPLGPSRAWSWQQGPMAQWVRGGPSCIYNDREDGAFVARLVDTVSGSTKTLPRPCYAVDPGGDFYFSLNMARLDRLRPGYGYSGGDLSREDERKRGDDGIWRVRLADGEARLILSLADAVDFLFDRFPAHRLAFHRLRVFYYWFNHIKLSPDGRRFTVKLRWRRPDGPWSDRQGVSLTGSVEGGDLRLLTDAPSHVIWLNEDTLYLWRGGELALFSDTSPRGRRLGVLGAGVIKQNVHIRHLPPGATKTPEDFVYDTPYQETIDLLHLHAPSGEIQKMANFRNHRPAEGPFRCDLHPCPDDQGRRIVVTSLHDGGRQVYLLERDV